MVLWQSDKDEAVFIHFLFFFVFVFSGENARGVVV